MKREIVNLLQSEIGCAEIRRSYDGTRHVKVTLDHQMLTTREARGLAQWLLLLADNIDTLNAQEPELPPPNEVRFDSLRPRAEFISDGLHHIKCEGNAGWAVTAGSYRLHRFASDFLVQPYNAPGEVRFDSLPIRRRFDYGGRRFFKCQGVYACTEDNLTVSEFEPDAAVEPVEPEG